MTLTVAPSTPFAADALFGPSFSGLVTVGVQVVDSGGAVVQARTTSGVAESPSGSGDYVKNFAASPGTAGTYRLAWDTGGGTPQWAFEDLIVAGTSGAPFIQLGGGGVNRLYVGDQNPTLGPVPLLRKDGSAVDLTGFTSMKFALRGEYDTADLFTPAAAPMLAPNVSGVFDGAGQPCWGVRYVWGTNDLAGAATGIYLGQWIGADGSSRSQHYSAGRFMLVKGF